MTQLKEITFSVDNYKQVQTVRPNNLLKAIKTLYSMQNNGYDIRILTINTI